MEGKCVLLCIPCEKKYPKTCICDKTMLVPKPEPLLWVFPSEKFQFLLNQQGNN